MKHFILLALLILQNILNSQEIGYTEKEYKISQHIQGSLMLPKENKPSVLAILIAGSGPTDRNGNQNFLKNDALKKLAIGLSKKQIATFRYDKRIVKQIRQGNVDKNISFDDFVTDAQDVISYFKTSNTFSKIVIIGHSQGSLVGMLAAKNKADAFISLAGAGQNIGDVIVEQVSKMAPKLGEAAKTVVTELKQGKTTSEYPIALASVFNKDLQPFMINWMKYTPTTHIAELQMPILIINGTKDLQVTETEAKLLKQANAKATLKLIKNMNHVLFTIEGGDLENSKSYNEGFRPISQPLLDYISTFITTQL